MITILLSTYNGEKYLKQQLDSLYAQTYKNIKIIVRDDGSTDSTMEILELYNLNILSSNKNVGSSNSFFILLEYALKTTDSEYFMFCDQDDIWYSDKIDKTLKKMEELEKKYSNLPLLVHTDLNVVNNRLSIINESFMLYQKIDAKYNAFNNLLMQNIITGCTTMLNKKLSEICCPVSSDFILHDWWIGLVASTFGKIGYLNESTISYRQHDSNSIGAKRFNFTYIIKKFNTVNILELNKIQAEVFLNKYENKLNKDQRNLLEDFILINKKSFLIKRILLIKYNLYKQGFLRNLGLFFKI